DLQVYYGVIQALKGISFEVNQGEVIALIGANGAGKTTTLQTLTGIIPSKAGSITFEGKDITKIPAHKIVEMGMAHVPEGRRVFADMTVYENLLMGAYTRKDKNEIAQSLANVYKRLPRWFLRSSRRRNLLYTFARLLAISCLSLRVYAPIRRFSYTVISANTRRPSGTWAIPISTILWAGIFVISFPSKVILPALDGMIPVSVCRVVVFPAPLAPIRAMTSPWFTSKDIPFKAWMTP